MANTLDESDRTAQWSVASRHFHPSILALDKALHDDSRRLPATSLIPPVSVPEAAVLMTVSIRTVQRMVASGELRALRYGRRVVRIPHEELLRMLEIRLQPCGQMLEPGTPDRQDRP